jgi:hypothetical protein
LSPGAKEQQPGTAFVIASQNGFSL